MIRLLLLGRWLKADIYPWSARLALVLAIFGSAQSPAERTRLGDSVDLMTFTCRGFPYAAPIASATELVSFGVIAQQAAAVTASSGAEDRTADETSSLTMMLRNPLPMLPPTASSLRASSSAVRSSAPEEAVTAAAC